MAFTFRPPITSATLLLFAIAGVVGIMGGEHWSCSKAGPRRWAKHRCPIATENEERAQVCDQMKSANDVMCGLHGDDSAPCKAVTAPHQSICEDMDWKLTADLALIQDAAKFDADSAGDLRQGVWQFSEAGKYCTSFTNLVNANLISLGATLEACKALVASKPLGCTGNHVQYAASSGNCGCGTSGCNARTSDGDWDIYSFVADNSGEVSDCTGDCALRTSLNSFLPFFRDEKLMMFDDENYKCGWMDFYGTVVNGGFGQITRPKQDAMVSFFENTPDLFKPNVTGCPFRDVHSGGATEQVWGTSSREICSRTFICWVTLEKDLPGYQWRSFPGFHGTSHSWTIKFIVEKVTLTTSDEDTTLDPPAKLGRSFKLCTPVSATSLNGNFQTILAGQAFLDHIADNIQGSIGAEAAQMATLFCSMV